MEITMKAMFAKSSKPTNHVYPFSSSMADLADLVYSTSPTIRRLSAALSPSCKVEAFHNSPESNDLEEPQQPREALRWFPQNHRC
jgi:hypothetical protein